jgi:hypothetical protein
VLYQKDAENQDNGSSFNFFGGKNQLSNFFNNLPDQLAQTDNIGGNAGFTGNLSPYFQDDYRVSRKLTINVGLRWDYYNVPSERFGRVVGVEGSTFPISQLHFKQPGQSIINPDYTSFGPRFGFAYGVGETGKTVVRGGAGIFVGNNYPGLLTIAASTYIPPMIPASLYSSGYTRSITYFTPSTAPGLSARVSQSASNPFVHPQSSPPSPLEPAHYNSYARAYANEFLSIYTRRGVLAAVTHAKDYLNQLRPTIHRAAPVAQ